MHIESRPSGPKTLAQSRKLAEVRYDIRGPLLAEAQRLEAEGHRILKLNIGNPAPFGLFTDDDILTDVLRSLPDAQGYSDSRGILVARRAVVQYHRARGIEGINVDDVFLGNGVSELITMALQGLLDEGDEVLVPTPDYPLWTAAVNLSGGQAVHYHCDEGNGWNPNLDHLESRITKRTKALVVINPNNPTGAVYSRDTLERMVELARKHGLVLFADEIYDQILYDDAKHVTLASLAPDLFCITMNGLSKAYRLAGYRSGWMVLSGPRDHATDYVEGLNLLSNMRLCPNVPAQYAVATALGADPKIVRRLVLPGGRLRDQRDAAYNKLTAIPGVTCVKPEGALYLFPRLDPELYGISDDTQFCIDLLRAKKMLLTAGSGFNWIDQDHFRIVTLPSVDDLADAMGRLGDFLDGYRQ